MDTPDRDLVVLGDTLRILRRKREWTQEEFAERAGIDLRHYQDIEAGKVDFGVQILRKIHGVLGGDWNTTMGSFGGVPVALMELAGAGSSH